MEEYVNKDTIIKDESYEVVKDSITCPICSALIIELVMCLNCQHYYCKKCIEEYKKKNRNCPNKCENPIFKEVEEENNMITMCKFKCIKGCGLEILFNDIKFHYSVICASSIKRRIKVLNREQEYDYIKKTGKKIPTFTSKSK